MVDVYFKFLYKLCKGAPKVVVLHSLGGLEPWVIQKLDYSLIGSSAFHKIMVKLPQEVPVFYDRRIHTLLQDALIVFFAGLNRIIFDILANI